MVWSKPSTSANLSKKKDLEGTTDDEKKLRGKRKYTKKSKQRTPDRQSGTKHKQAEEEDEDKLDETIEAIKNLALEDFEDMDDDNFDQLLEQIKEELDRLICNCDESEEIEEDEESSSNSSPSYEEDYEETHDIYIKKEELRQMIFDLKILYGKKLCGCQKPDRRFDNLTKIIEDNLTTKEIISTGTEDIQTDEIIKIEKEIGTRDEPTKEKETEIHQKEASTGTNEEEDPEEIRKQFKTDLNDLCQKIIKTIEEIACNCSKLKKNEEDKEELYKILKEQEFLVYFVQDIKKFEDKNVEEDSILVKALENFIEDIKSSIEKSSCKCNESIESFYSAECFGQTFRYESKKEEPLKKYEDKCECKNNEIVKNVGNFKISCGVFCETQIPKAKEKSMIKDARIEYRQKRYFNDNNERVDVDLRMKGKKKFKNFDYLVKYTTPNDEIIQDDDKPKVVKEGNKIKIYIPLDRLEKGK